MIWMLWAAWVVVLTAGVVGIFSSVRALGTHVWAIAAVGVIAFVARGGASTEYFFGLEDEDAFVYAEASRHLSATTVVWNAPGLAVCVIGHGSDCAAWEAYPGHLFGFPALLAAVQQFHPFYPGMAPQVVGVLSTLTALFVMWAASAIHRSTWQGTLAGILFAVTPALALYGGSAVSEAASSTVIAVALGAVGMAQGKEGREWWRWHTVAYVAAMLAISVRRENVVLLPIVAFCLSIGRGQFRWSYLWPWLALLAFSAGRVAGSLVNEIGEYGQLSFGVPALLETLPVVLGALLNPEWFGFVALLAILGFWLALRKVSSRDGLREHAAVIGTAIAAGTMVLLYASHIRSTYQLHGAAVEPVDFLRYLSNVGVPLCIVAAGAVWHLYPTAMSLVRGAFTAGALALYVIANFAMALQVRSEMIAIENGSRREPALKAIEVAASLRGEYPIVTLEPLVAQIYARDDQTVVSLSALTSELVEIYEGKLLYLEQQHYQSDIDRRRYGSGLAALPTAEPVEASRGDGWSILRWH